MIEASNQTQTSLPQGWQLKSLGDIIDIRNGYAFKSKDFTTNGTLLVRQSNLSSNGVNTSKSVYLPEPYLNKYASYKVSKGDVLIGMSGSIGKVCVYDFDKPALQNQRTGLIEFTIPEYKEYITYYLQYAENELLALAKGEVVKNISSQQIKSYCILLPPTDQAQRIASKIRPLLAELETATEKLVLVKTNLKHYLDAVLQKSLYYKQNDKHLKLGQVTQIIHGYSFPLQYVNNDNEGIPFFKVADLAHSDSFENKFMKQAQNYISAADCRKLKLKPLKPGSIVFAKTGEAIKRNLRAITKLPTLIDNNMIGITTSCDELNNRYLYFFLLTIRLENLSKATTVPSVRKSDIANIYIPLPPVSYQLQAVKEIEVCFTSASILAKTLNHNLEQAGLLRQSILKKAFDGKLIDN